MELRQARYLLALKQEGSLGAAARALHVTAPTVGRQLRDLETRLGVGLLREEGGTMTLTAAGVRLAEGAASLLALERSIVSEAQGAAPESVRLGLAPGLHRDALARILRELRALRLGREASFSFSQDDSAAQLIAARAGELDIALVHARPPTHWPALPLLTEPLGFARPPDHPPVGALGELAGTTVLLHSDDQMPGLYASVAAPFERAGTAVRLTPRRFFEYSAAWAEVEPFDAVVLTRDSAAQQVPDWVWASPAEFAVELRTWATCRPGGPLAPHHAAQPAGD